MNENTVSVGIMLIFLGAFLGWLFFYPGLLALIGVVLVIYGMFESKEETAAQHPSHVPTQYPLGPGGSTNFCSFCGQQVTPGALSCPRCGRRLT